MMVEANGSKDGIHFTRQPRRFAEEIETANHIGQWSLAYSQSGQAVKTLSSKCLSLNKKGNGGVKEIQKDGEADDGQEEDNQKGSWVWVTIRVASDEGEEAPNTDTGWEKMQPPGSTFIKNHRLYCPHEVEA
ncbi:hypothetical protein Bca101_056612 [Brassica carinata]